MPSCDLFPVLRGIDETWWCVFLFHPTILPLADQKGKAGKRDECYYTTKRIVFYFHSHSERALLIIIII